MSKEQSKKGVVCDIFVHLLMVDLFAASVQEEKG
jgi:hypothetical protein